MKINIKNTNQWFWIANLAGWILYGIFMTLFFRKGDFDNFISFYLNFVTYLSGFIITSLLRYILRYIQKKINNILTGISLLIVLIYISTLTWYFLDIFLSYHFWKPERAEYFFKSLTFYGLIKINFSQFFLVFGWIAMYFGTKFWIDYQNEKESKEEALLLAQRAELEMLRYQLNPHFLFNSLNSIRALVDENQKAAKSMITELSEFLRYSLLQKELAFVPLSRELEAIKHYLSIEKKRFEEKLEIEYNISDQAKDFKVLSFLLHPLIENAIKHGMKTSKMPLKILLQSYIHTNEFNLTICNSGKWIESVENHDGTGTGLQNVEKRLKNAYKYGYQMTINKEENIVCIQIKIRQDIYDQ
ncbi:MAG: hypothetical protein A2X13_07470 [Bacteroidetes bacterium GWC2_33_15]|nr:MAG: hypothetical protein A2X10_01325 [Bacteroidetes bacterium GWA2_33_15]OFX48626.1 MAG: hypothetical protein A2X13_07470 [Bacteroidetes bacterium GWC2_33_15]OFX64600.1 MAG: hypothetical protein A2X15_05060 [Bacteroidetes bacterium GWB2_32_14]OFX67982.1 MAG: hypothetical protein A2X14_01715 [Bacteroidetes bacterium GWD2_33_33]HAN18216.1 hypothetical protein [Bacteroidales bacterium]